MNGKNDGRKERTMCSLPLYVLRIFLSYLDVTSLYMLSQTCTYLRECIEDPMLWRYVDARSLPHTTEKYEYITKRLNEKTTHVFYSGGVSLPSRFFTSNPFESLIVLSLENQTIVSPKVLLKDFPPTLQELSLRNTLLKYNSDDFFQHSCNVMSKLRVLILDECSWLTSSFLLSVSKFDSLEIISVVRCQRVHLQTIPYLSIARYGCKKLKVLDCRFTGIGGEVLRTFFASESIQRMYFQSVNTSEVDYGRALPKNGSLLEDICANADFVTITDGCLADYMLVLPSTATKDPVCESVLYKDPYPECTCGLEDPEEAERILNVELEDQDMIRYVSGEVTKFVCRKHNKDLEKLPNSVRNFFTANQRECDYDSDPDSDSDPSDSEEGRNCCLYGMGSKIIVASPDVTTPRGELSMAGPSNTPPMNIVVVKPRAEPTAEEESNARPTAEPAATGASSSVDAADPPPAAPDADPQPGPSSSKPTEGPKKRSADTDPRQGPSKRARPCCKTLNIIYSDGTIVRRRFDRSDDAQQEAGPSNRDRPPRALVIASVNLSRNHTAPANANEAMERTSAQLRDVRSRLVRNLNYCVRSDRPRGRRSVIVGVEQNPAEQNVEMQIDANRNPPEPSGGSGSGANGDEASTSQDGPEDPDRPPRANPSRPLRVDPRNIRRLVNIMVQDYENSNRHMRAIMFTEQWEELRNPFRPHPTPPTRIQPEGLTLEGNLTNLKKYLEAFEAERPKTLPPSAGFQFSLNSRHFYLCVTKFSNRKRDVNLCRLSLRGYKNITDQSLQYLAHLKLELLDLTYTSVTKAGIDGFLNLNPDCRIIHHLYCTCKPRNPF